jgi:hypothetical protein
MARGQKGSGRQPPVKGFRPGKEPPQLRKQRVQEPVAEPNWAQQRLVETLSGRTPEEARAMMGRWRAGVLGVTVLLAALTALLFRWSIVAGGVGAVLTTVAFVLWLRLRMQRASLDQLADALSRQRRR